MKILYNPKDIVLSPVDYTDGSWYKHRPVLILSNDREDFLIAPLSTQLNHAWLHDIVLAMNSINNLRKDSVIRLSKLATQSGLLFEKKLGEISYKNRKKLKYSMVNYVQSW